MQDYRQILKTSFTDRRNKNPSYSLRTFAADAGVSASMLSEILNHKKKLARKTALKISTALRFNKRQQDAFLLSVDYEKPALGQNKEQLAEKMRNHARVGKVLVPMTGQEEVISNPQYVTLLAMLKLKNFRYNLTWISGLLGTFQHETNALFKKLTEIGSIRFNEKNEPETVHNFIASNGEVSVDAVRAYHRTSLNRALHAIDSVPQAERSYFSSVFAIHDEDFPLIQEEIRQFQEQLFLKYGHQTNANRVYSLQNQFIPMTGKNPLK